MTSRALTYPDDVDADAKRTEAALRDANARLRLLHVVAAAANDACELEEALQTTVDEICNYTGWPVGHAYLRGGASGTGLVSSGIWHVDDPDRFAGFRRVTEATCFDPGRGLPGQVLETGRPAWRSDLSTDPQSPRAREGADAGIGAGFAFPVSVGEEVSAVLEFFSTRTMVPDEDLLELMAQVGTQLGRVAERQRAQQELAEARDEALRASQSKSDFLAVMSHEIRTPMNAVIGLTGLLLDSELNETQRHHAEGVRVSAEALLGIINDILDFSKIEAGTLELETVDFDLARAMDEVGILVAESASMKGLELGVHCRPEVPTALRGDVGRLRQILLNLAANAVKFTEAGEVVLRAELADAAPSEEVVVVHFEVADTGIGIAPDAAARLFDPFSQGDPSTTRRYGGTGLGLAICKRLAEAMGGTIGLHSREGAGSTFWARLPFTPASEPVGTSGEARSLALQGRRAPVVDDNETNRLALTAQPQAWDITVHDAADAHEGLDRLRGPSPFVPPGSKGTLLIVEDHSINQEVIKYMVAKLGYGCDVAADGIEALHALERRSYDAVLMDCHMPRMDGFQATAEIRRRESGRHVPIFALTADALVDSRQKCIVAGMDDYLAKPVKSRDLQDMLDRWLDRDGEASVRSEAVALPQPVDADGVLDMERFDILRETAATEEPGSLVRLVDRYIEGATSRLRQLREAAQRGDAAALEEAAHGLKGTSATMSATALASVCAAVEAAAAQGEVAGPEVLDRVSAEFERAATALRANAGANRPWSRSEEGGSGEPAESAS